MQRVVPLTNVIDLTRKSVVQDYHLRPQDLVSYGGDPLEWTNDLGGTLKAPVRSYSKNDAPKIYGSLNSALIDFTFFCAWACSGLLMAADCSLNLTASAI